MRIRRKDTDIFTEESQEDSVDSLAYMEKLDKQQDGLIENQADNTLLDLPDILSDEILTEKLAEITGGNRWAKWKGYGDPALHPGEPVDVQEEESIIANYNPFEKPFIFKLYHEVQTREHSKPSEAQASPSQTADAPLAPQADTDTATLFHEKTAESAEPMRPAVPRTSSRERFADNMTPTYTSAPQEIVQGHTNTLAAQVGQGTYSILAMARDCLCGLATGVKSAMLARVAEAKETQAQLPYSSMLLSPDEFHATFQAELQQRTYRWERANKHCLLLEERMLNAEKLADSLSVNPIIAGYTARFQNEGQASPELLAQLKNSLDDPYNPYGMAAKNDMRSLFSSLAGIEKDMDKTASACAKVQSTEKLEARLHTFLSDMQNRPESALISEPETGRSLKESISGMFDKLKQVFNRIKSVFIKEKYEESETQGLTPSLA